MWHHRVPVISFLPGTPVRARGLDWEVVEAEPSGEELRYRLRCTTRGPLSGRELDVLTPLELIEPRARGFDPKRAGRRREWLLYHDAFLLEQALGSSALVASDPGRLDIAPYQLVPVMRALSMTRPRIMLADGVGLGKTVEAGLVMAELIARRRAQRILIVSPAGPLLEQWSTEMRARFGLRFDVVRDWSGLQDKRRELVLGANPFDHMALCLASIDFVKQEKVLSDLERTSWDVVVIDEAHHCAKLGRAADREDSRRRRLAEVLARQSDGFLLLTATPHDGYDEHFASLIELLDPSLVDGRGVLRGEAYQRHVVRRLKQHIKHPVTGEPLFQTREVIPRPVVPPSGVSAFQSLHASILAMVAPRLRQALRKKEYGEVLAFVALLKRSVSSVRACGNTLEKIAARYQELAANGQNDDETRKQRIRTLRDYRRRMERYGALSFEDEQDQALLEAEDIAADLSVDGLEQLSLKIDELERGRRRSREARVRGDTTLGTLRTLVELAREAEADDPKLAAVLAEVGVIRAAEPRANVLVYTEYTDSQDALTDALEKHRLAGELEGEVLTIRGDDPEKKRISITDRFRSESGLILVSTDATAEGLNLHDRCHHLIHFELPYNPNRLEQRNGRIDRYGQKLVPTVRYLYLVGTFEERLLMRLVTKYERQRARLTFVPNTLGILADDRSRGVERLLAGLAEEEGQLFRPHDFTLQLTGPAPEDATSAAYRDLLAEVETAMNGFEKARRAHAWLGDVGSHADARSQEDALKARDRGRALMSLDLVDFVADAIASESRSADANVRRADGVIVLKIPPEWRFGLDELPGYDDEAKTFYVSKDSNRTRDDAGVQLGYLGRAHPLVRRALERVRNAQFGDTSHLDRRVTAILTDVPSPTLAYTFLVGFRSKRGRELERVVVASATASDTLPHAELDAHAFCQRVAAAEPAPTAGAWERHFAWADERVAGHAAQAAELVFDMAATELLAEHDREVAAETTELDRWLRQRALELCGEPRPQTTLFTPEHGAPTWKTTGTPLERITSFATDKSVPSRERREADGALQLYRVRAHELERRRTLERTPAEPLGLVMLLPRGGV